MGHAMHRMPLSAARSNLPRAPALSALPRPPSLASAALVLRTARAFGSEDEDTSTAFLSAVRLYQDCHWEFAFERLTALADDGHASASKLALLMLRYGSSLYGTTFKARPGQIARWAQRVLRATSRATASPSSMTASA
jgi:hypothetical protein